MGNIYCSNLSLKSSFFSVELFVVLAFPVSQGQYGDDQFFKTNK